MITNDHRQHFFFEPTTDFNDRSKCQTMDDRETTNSSEFVHSVDSTRILNPLSVSVALPGFSPEFNQIIVWGQIELYSALLQLHYSTKPVSLMAFVYMTTFILDPFSNFIKYSDSTRYNLHTFCCMTGTPLSWFRIHVRQFCHRSSNFIFTWHKLSRIIVLGVSRTG